MTNLPMLEDDYSGCAFDDVEKRRAKDLATILVVHAQEELRRARKDAEEALENALEAAEILRHATDNLKMWSEMLAEANVLRESVDTGEREVPVTCSASVPAVLSCVLREKCAPP